jgi:ABC-type antimicrobial peptide transport system permease subunit
MTGVLRDLRYAARQLRKNPGFTAVGVIALALGAGLSTTIFSIFYNGVLNPFPYRDQNRLTVIGIQDTSHGSERWREVFHLDEVVAFRQGNHTFDDIVAYSGWDVAYSHLLVGTGILLGLVAAALSVRIVKSQLWGVSAFDFGTFLLAPLALLATGLLASYIPARRATRVDPMVALRHE